VTKEQILKQFGANAAAYAVSDVHAKGASLNRLLEHVNPSTEWDMLDVATGAGHTALTFAPYVKGVTATDITPEMLAQAEILREQRRLHNVHFETADAADLPYSDASFDLVTCRIAPHHFPDIARFVAESVRVLRTGGLLAVVDNIVPPGPVGDFVNAFEKLRDPSHECCWSLEEWLGAFAAEGLVIETQETLAKRLNFQFWVQRHNRPMQSYLRALLTEGGLAVRAFLQPHGEDSELSFRLVEGIVIGRKSELDTD
jgi:SAM-dependent methyltransferase